MANFHEDRSYLDPFWQIQLQQAFGNAADQGKPADDPFIEDKVLRPVVATRIE